MKLALKFIKSLTKGNLNHGEFSLLIMINEEKEISGNKVTSVSNKGPQISVTLSKNRIPVSVDFGELGSVTLGTSNKNSQQTYKCNNKIKNYFKAAFKEEFLSNISTDSRFLIAVVVMSNDNYKRMDGVEINTEDRSMLEVVKKTCAEAQTKMSAFGEDGP
jgi:ribosomal protein L14